MSNSGTAAPGKGRKCCRLLVFAFLLIGLAVAGGIILWQFLPENQKSTISSITGIDVAGDYQEEGPPPPPYQFDQCAGGQAANCCNGLESNCNRTVDKIMYAGIHNGQASYDENFLLAPNHLYRLEYALQYGYRAINLDVGECDGELRLVHSKCKLGTRDPLEVFAHLNDFLNAHPTEVLLVPLQIDQEAGGGLVDLGRIYNMLRSIDGGNFTQKLYQQTSGEPWPTLRQMIDSNKRVLLFHYNSDEVCANPEVTCPPGFHDWFAFATETVYSFDTEEDLQDKNYSCTTTRGRPRAPFFALNVFLKIPSRPVSSEVLNTQSFLENHIQACTDLNSQFEQDVNVVFVDFWDTGDLPRVVQEHNTRLGGLQQQQPQERRRRRHRWLRWRS